jgi:hypothetical protein
VSITLAPTSEADPMSAISLTDPSTWFTLALLMVLAYLARQPAHRAIQSLTRILHGGLRMGAKALARTEEGLRGRNREVLLASGREASERLIEREFERISASVQRDLSRYPEVQRQLGESIQRMDEDHEQSVDVPPEVPGWTEAVDAMAKLSAKRDGAAARVIEAIHGSMADTHDELLTEYRKESARRHGLLARMRPEWRRVQGSLAGMQQAVDQLLERSRSVDRHMEDYREISRGSDRAVQMLSSSSMVQFFVSAFVLAIAVGGAMINFSLIARPMSEMVGGTSYIGAFQTADIAALVIILVEMSMGLFLMESLRITRLFPVVSALPDETRRRMVWVTLGILLALASVEAGLAYMRELLMQDELATTALLRGQEGGELNVSAMWITTAAQMGMGFVLPLALTFVAIPLESFIQSLRTVLGLLAILVLQTFGVLLRVTANGMRQLGQFLVQLYDLFIFAPLWIEARIQGMRESRDQWVETETQPATAPSARTDAAAPRDGARSHDGIAYGAS